MVVIDAGNIYITDSTDITTTDINGGTTIRISQVDSPVNGT